MGTGSVSILAALFHWGNGGTALKVISLTFFFINLFFYIVILSMTVARYWMFPEVVPFLPLDNYNYILIVFESYGSRCCTNQEKDSSLAHFPSAPHRSLIWPLSLTNVGTLGGLDFCIPSGDSGGSFLAVLIGPASG